MAVVRADLDDAASARPEARSGRPTRPACARRTSNRYDGPAPRSPAAAQPGRRPAARPSPSSTAPAASARKWCIPGTPRRRTPTASPPARRARSPRPRVTAASRRSAPTARGRPSLCARRSRPSPGKPNAPRIAIVVGGLGIGATATNDAIASCRRGDARVRALWRRSRAPGRARARGAATRCCCRCRWSRSTIPTTIPARRRC